jgi:transposase-like protein
MGTSEFAAWLRDMTRLTAAQRTEALRALAAEDRSDSAATGAIAASSNEPASAAEGAVGAGAVPVSTIPAIRKPDGLDPLAAVVHRRVESVGCPHCGGRDLGRWGQASALPRYRCKACRRTFNALTGTPLSHLRKKDKWSEQARAMSEGATLAKTAERCDVHPTTAFRWRHRFLKSLSSDKPKTLTGIVEGDETFILESFKGKRSTLPRAARKRGGKAAKRGLSAEQVPVIVARDRTGATIDAVLPKLDRASIDSVLGGVITPANQFCCDGGTAILAFARRAGIPVHVLPAPGKPDPKAPDLHITPVNAYHGRFKEWMRRFHGVATKNLPNYLGWRRAIEAFQASPQPKDWILGAVGLGPYQQKTL